MTTNSHHHHHHNECGLDMQSLKPQVAFLLFLTELMLFHFSVVGSTYTSTYDTSSEFTVHLPRYITAPRSPEIDTFATTNRIGGIHFPATLPLQYFTLPHRLQQSLLDSI
jgi:hypothetical protein